MGARSAPSFGQAECGSARFGSKLGNASGETKHGECLTVSLFSVPLTSQVLGFREAPRHYLGDGRTQSKTWETEVGVPLFSGTQLPLGLHIEESGMKDGGPWACNKAEVGGGPQAEVDNEPFEMVIYILCHCVL